MPQLAIYIETKEPVDHDDLPAFLASRGNRAADVRDVSVNEDGLIITDFLLQGHWNHGTDQATCTGECADAERRRLEWDKLSDPQQQNFAEAMGKLMLHTLDEHFVAAHQLEDDQEFDDITLTPLTNVTQQIKT